MTSSEESPPVTMATFFFMASSGSGIKFSLDHGNAFLHGLIQR
jgi:hypothetical protein